MDPGFAQGNPWIAQIHASRITYIYPENTSTVITPLVVITALLLGSMVMKLMFTVWIVVHLFALAVFHKKLQRLEPLYVASSLVIPLMVTIVILPIGVVGERHIISKYACMIEDIMYIIVFGVLVLTSWLIFTMGMVLCYRACRRRNMVLSEYDKQHKKALCEMLPLLLYPILFLLQYLHFQFLISRFDHSSTMD